MSVAWTARAVRRVSSGSLAPTLVGLAVAVIATSTWADVRRPVIEHDDWDMLLPDGAAFVENHQQRVLHEGRWLNYWWWQLGSVHLTPVTATVGFALGWLVVTATLTRVLARGWWAVPIAVALYASPMISQISSWPATTLPPVAVLALGSVGLAVTRDRWWRHLAVLLAAVFLLVLGYPPFALLLLPLLVALHAHARWRRLAALGCAVAGAYVAGLLTICVLNAVHFGVFGIQIAAWRHPTPLTGVGALLQHLGVMRHDAHVLVATTAAPLAIVVCVVLPLAAAGGQRRLVVLGLAFLLALGLSAAITLLTGVDVPFRSSGWLWSLGVVAVAWALESPVGALRLVAGACAVAVGVWSAAYWTAQVRGHQRFESVLDPIEARVAALYARAPEPIVFAPRVRHAGNAADIQTAWQLGNALAKERGIEVAGRCHHCGSLVAFAQRRFPDQAVFRHRGQIVVRFPESVVRRPLDDLPMPHWVTPLA